MEILKEIMENYNSNNAMSMHILEEMNKRKVAVEEIKNQIEDDNSIYNKKIAQIKDICNLYQYEYDIFSSHFNLKPDINVNENEISQELTMYITNYLENYIEYNEFKNIPHDSARATVDTLDKKIKEKKAKMLGDFKMLEYNTAKNSIKLNLIPDKGIDSLEALKTIIGELDKELHEDKRVNEIIINVFFIILNKVYQILNNILINIRNIINIQDKIMTIALIMSSGMYSDESIVQYILDFIALEEENKKNETIAENERSLKEAIEKNTDILNRLVRGKFEKKYIKYFKKIINL
jgi:hypothetical protein